ncbi:MAG TPA: hypothetical protein VJN70_20595 [Gemmatimonadaceae bacterium]|nr:hypothetical protein [Gemmatimonadaceae bacterium]
MNQLRNRSKPRGPRERTLEEVAEAEDHRLTIAAALTATPIDDPALRRGVCAYVSSERGIGTLHGDVITRLTMIVHSASARTPVREALMRRVTRWCVQAYFGQLGGAR